MRNDAKGREREDFEVTKPGDDSYMIFAAERERERGEVGGERSSPGEGEEKRVVVSLWSSIK